MLSDEEKKAILELNHYCNLTQYWKNVEYTKPEFDNYITTILNLIEKQSKEIEVLKDTNKKLYEMGKQNAIQELINNNYITKDKIKSKIEDYKKEQEFYNKNEDREWGQYSNWDWIDSFINELQSFLEKE